MSVDFSPPVEHHSPCRAEAFDPHMGGEVITQALQIVNAQLDLDCEIVYIGQPVKPQEPDARGLRISPNEPLDLVIRIPGIPGKPDEPIDFVNVVVWKEYDPLRGRLTDGFKQPETLAVEILEKVIEHRAAKDNPNILISSAGSKFNVKPLTENTMSIDVAGFLRLNNLQIWSNGEPLKAASLRSCGIMDLTDTRMKGYIRMEEKGEIAPEFYIKLVPEDIQGQAEKGYILSREPGKI